MGVGRLPAAIAAVVLVLLGFPSMVSAEVPSVKLVSSSPAAAAVIDAVPDEVVLAFTGPMRAESARLTVLEPDGSRTELSDVRAERHTIKAYSPVFSSNGTYHLEWRALAASGEESAGRIAFTVAGAGFASFLMEHALHLVGVALMLAFVVTALRRARKPAR